MIKSSLKYIVVAGLLLLSSSCGVQFASMALEDPYARFVETDPFKDFASGVVYANTTGNEVWAPEACGELKFDSERSFEGNAIHIQWDQSQGCDWVGMGIGWDAWEPKDLSQIMDKAAFQFQFRAFEGESRVPIMIFLLEDYATTMTAAALRAGYMESYPLNEEWRTVTVPMSDFPAAKDGIDLTSIKQMVIELQGKGNVMIDDFKIVPLDNVMKENGKPAVKPSITPLATLPVPIFEGQLPNAWGLERNECRDFKFENGDIVMEWWDECPWSPMGLSWNRWIGVDMSAAMESGVLEVEASIEANSDPVRIELNDYNWASGVRVAVELQNYTPVNGVYRIPLKDFMTESVFQFENVKDLWIDTRGKGKASISSIRIVEG